MTPFEIYILILCFVVFVLLTATFSYFIATNVKLTIALIRAGAKDEEIQKEPTSKKNEKLKKVDGMVSIISCVILLAVFAFSLYINLQKDRYTKQIPTLSVVRSDSMEKKNKKNSYLYENNLNNQLQVFDLIVTHKLPKEEDLELYDIVVYEQDKKLVVHRIVGIEEPNESHSDQRHFLCQGDALDTPDRFPVLYSQMRGIYKNERVPIVGNFILFMQSPAGWLCMLLVIFTIFITPVLEKKVETEKKKRVMIIRSNINESEKYEK